MKDTLQPGLEHVFSFLAPLDRYLRPSQQLGQKKTRRFVFWKLLAQADLHQTPRCP